MDIKNATTADLQGLLKSIPEELRRRENSEKERLRNELTALASKAGFTIAQLFAENEKVGRKQSVVAPKYCHPTDRSLTWTGRGRQPKWIAEILSNGGTLKSLAID